MRELWIADISKEEEKSHKFWKPKTTFLNKYVQNYGEEPTEPKQRVRKQNQQTQRKVPMHPRSRQRQPNTFNGKKNIKKERKSNF